MQKPKRENKSKEELLREADRKKQMEEKVVEAKRQRSVFRDKIAPMLSEMDEEVRYVNVFMQTASAAVQSGTDEVLKDLKIKDLDTMKLFDPKAPGSAPYKKLFDILAEESITSFNQMFDSAPRAIAEYLYSQGEKKKFNDLNIDEILSKD